MLAANFVQLVEMHPRPDVKGKEKEELAKKLAEFPQNMADLEKAVAAFKGPHFDATYRQSQELVTKAGQCLDALVLNLDPYGAQKNVKREILIHLTSLTKALNEKVHKDGKRCENGCN